MINPSDILKKGETLCAFPLNFNDPYTKEVLLHFQQDLELLMQAQKTDYQKLNEIYITI